MNTIMVHLLISGKDVYGFTVDGFEKLIDWEIKICGDFAMFLSHILHTVIHNYKMHRLNEEIANELDLDAMMNRADDKMYEQKMARKAKRR